MKILLHTIVAGPEGCFQPGVRLVPDDLALRLIEEGYAEEIGHNVPVGEAPPPPKMATVRPSRNAAVHHGR